MFFKYVTRSASKADIKFSLMNIAADNGEELSPSRADRLADKFKRGLFDPDLARYIQYSDPVGELAAKNVDNERLLAA